MSKYLNLEIENLLSKIIFDVKPVFKGRMLKVIYINGFTIPEFIKIEELEKIEQGKNNKNDEHFFLKVLRF